MLFKPTGTLNISTDPVLIGDGDMQRCKNLNLDKNGIARTRYGKHTIGNATIVIPSKIIEQVGNRYSFGSKIYRNESSIASGIEGGNWDAILYNPYNSTVQSIYSSNGLYLKRIENSTVYTWGIAAPENAPTIANGGGSGLTGDYNAKYSYCRKEGTTVVSESNLSDAASAAVTLADDELSITWTASSDSQVTHVRLYRTMADGSIYYHDQDVAIGTTTTTTDTADTALGTAEHTNHDTPPAGNIVLGPNYNGVCFILKDNRVYFCLAKQPDYWPSTYYVEAGPRQQALVSGEFYNGQLWVASENAIYQIAGSGSQTFFPIRQDAVVGGTLSRYGMVSIRGHGLFHVLADGIYLFSTSGDKKVTRGELDDIFAGYDSGGMPGINDLSKSWMITYKDKFYFAYAADDNLYPRHVIVHDLTTGQTSYYDWGIEISAVCNDHTNRRFLAVDTDGNIWHLENGTQDFSADWEIESKDFTLSTRAHFPRMVKYDIDASSASNVTGKLILDGAIHQEHTITGNRNTKRRLVAGGNGERCSIRVSGTGQASIYAMESE